MFRLSGHGGVSFFQIDFELRKALHPATGEVRDPAVGNLLDRDGVQIVIFEATGLACGDKGCVFQRPQVFHQGKPRESRELGF